MCEYCVQHGHGKKWYLNARNYSKDLAHSEKVKQFCESFFGREITPGAKELLPSGPITVEERQKENHRYMQYLHHQVISTDEALSILKLASYQTDESERAVVLLPCICRYSAYGSDPNLSCYGIAFTDEYTHRFPKYCGGAHQYVSAEEAQETLEALIKTGPVVHAMSALGVPYLGMLCNCDMPVCRPYLLRKRLEITSPIYKAHQRAQVDVSKCTGCGICETKCPFGVPTIDSQNNLASIESHACFGCGVCQRYCPENAITFKPVGESIPF